mmetsp:Transcript_53345/g.147771  ORF Transcript_53345/g.147771 Transcript_53345/m.147771 type:complete len:341 (+) Transcript_53345:806-1828(+)
MAVERHDVLVARERADQHHQRAFRQMEVGDEAVHHAELESRRDEDVGLAGAGLQRAALGGRLQRAQRRRADGHDTPPPRTAGRHRIDRGLRHLEPLAVHLVLGDLLDPHRLEGAGANMQGHMRLLDPAGGQRGQHAFVEMQGRRGRRDRTGLLGEHRLVAALVLGIVGMLDVGRQRHMAMVLQQREGVTVQAQVEQAVVRPAAAQHLRIEGIGKPHPAAGLGALAGAQMHPHLLRARQHPFNQGLHRTTGRRGAGFGAVLPAEQPRLDDAGVVEDQQITGRQQPGQLAEDPVHGRRAGRVQQPRGAALRRRMLGDQFRGQVEIEIVDAVGLGGRWVHGDV